MNCILNPEAIRRIREDEELRNQNPEKYDKHKKEWSLEECKKRGCLPIGEPLESLFGAGY